MNINQIIAITAIVIGVSVFAFIIINSIKYAEPNAPVNLPPPDWMTEKYLPLKDHEKFLLENEDYNFINDTSIEILSICDDWRESPIGFYCQNERPRTLDVYGDDNNRYNDLIIVSPTEFTYMGTVNTYKFHEPAKYDTIHEWINSCDEINGKPTITVWDSSMISANADCTFLSEPPLQTCKILDVRTGTCYESYDEIPEPLQRKPCDSVSSIGFHTICEQNQIMIENQERIIELLETQNEP